mgnify:CR=1 FL=1
MIQIDKTNKRSKMKILRKIWYILGYAYDWVDELDVHPVIGVTIGGIFGICIFSLGMALARYLESLQ